MYEKLQNLARAVRAEADGLVPSPRQTGYRARVTLHAGRDADGEGVFGYFRPGTHELEPLRSDELARPEINRALESITSVQGLERFELRSDGERVVANVLAGDGQPGESLAYAAGGRVQRGDPTLRLEVCGIEHRVSPDSFYQVNLEVNELLVEAVREEVLSRHPEALLDLYSGIGNLSMPIAATGVPCTLIEREGSSARDARHTAPRLGLPVTVLTQDASRFQAGSVPFDVAIVDPPRQGAARAIQQLLVTRPRALVVVSCNPRTLGRDIAPARKQGYRLTRLTGFDMFPGTPHLEALAVLER